MCLADIYNYDATFSWGGYLYQGMVAVYITLDYIYKNLDSNFADVNLEIEYIDDIALKKGNNYLSFHQVKSEKNNNFTNYEKPLLQMLYQKCFFMRECDYKKDAIPVFHTRSKINKINNTLELRDKLKYSVKEIEDNYNILIECRDNYSKLNSPKFKEKLCKIQRDALFNINRTKFNDSIKEIKDELGKFSIIFFNASLYVFVSTKKLTLFSISSINSSQSINIFSVFYYYISLVFKYNIYSESLIEIIKISFERMYENIDYFEIDNYGKLLLDIIEDKFILFYELIPIIQNANKLKFIIKPLKFEQLKEILFILLEKRLLSEEIADEMKQMLKNSICNKISIEVESEVDDVLGEIVSSKVQEYDDNEIESYKQGNTGLLEDGVWDEIKDVMYEKINELLSDTNEIVSYLSII